MRPFKFVKDVFFKTFFPNKVLKEYQQVRFPEVKFELLYKNIPAGSCNTLLDIGCNAGKITAAFSEKGFFAVGVDVNPRIITYENNKRPIMGYYPVTAESLKNVPAFDVVLLLSVHHQWVKEQGDKPTQQLILDIFSKAKQYMFIEFATLNDKYGYTSPRFDEQDERSQLQYCENWLTQCSELYGSTGASSKLEFKYLGKNRERIGVEEFRHIFMISRG